MAKTKKNNKSIYFKDWTTAKLKSEAKWRHDMIYGVNACYGTRDMMALDGILAELARRGIEPKNELIF